MSPKFGEQRLVRPDVGKPARMLYQLMGVADAPHYLHFRLLAKALASFGEFSPKRILDAGCGGGDYSFYLARTYPDARVLGVDIDASLIDRNRRTADLLGLTNVTFERCDLSATPFEAKFDLIVSIDVLEHISNQQAALRNLAGGLSAEGRLFFHIPTIREKPVPFSRWLGAFHAWAEDEHVADELTADEFKRRVEAAGIDVTSFDRTFGYYTGELATSLTALAYEDSVRHRVYQALLAPVCRLLVLADEVGHAGQPRYAVAISGRSARRSAAV